MQKLNTFHWHLEDDQGWRIEIKKYPLLVQKGCITKQHPLPWDRTKFDGVQYGPYYYTQEQAREVVEYARKLAITVVPEIEMPGHATGALSGYPEYSCKGVGPFEPLDFWGGSKDVFCPGNDKTYEFLYGILDEIMEIFDSKYIHCGGDECSKLRWKTCPKCQKRIKDEGLKSENELQSWFVSKIAHYLETKGRHLIGWDEISHGGIPKEASVMSWTGVTGGIEAAKQGHNVIMVPNQLLYLDHGQFPFADKYEYIVDYTTKKVSSIYMIYNYEPTSGVPEEYQKYIIGIQGNLWTEYVWGGVYDIEYKYFPRQCATAEIGWSTLSQKNWNGFLTRLVRSHMDRLSYSNINHASLTGHQKILWSSKEDGIKSDCFVRKEWSINGSIGLEGFYQVAFVLKSGSPLIVKDIAMFYENQCIGTAYETQISGQDHSSIFTFNIKSNGENHDIRICCSLSCQSKEESKGEILVLYTPN